MRRVTRKDDSKGKQRPRWTVIIRNNSTYYYSYDCCAAAVIVRTALIPFACTTKNGISVLNDEPTILCSPDISAYRRMHAIGIALVVLFGAGLPFLFIVILRRYGSEMFFDQLLRVRNEGESGLTNPHISIRRRYRKLYEDYKVRSWYCQCLLVSYIASS